jgi:hypothetical protein
LDGIAEMKKIVLFLFWLCTSSCSDIKAPEIFILQPAHESVHSRGGLNFTKPIVFEYKILQASSCGAPSVYLDYGPLVFHSRSSGVNSYGLESKLEIDFALLDEGHHELRIVLSCPEGAYESAVIFEVLHLRYPFNASHDSMDACLLNASASPYPFMHIFHGSWTATIPDPPLNFQDGDLILDIGANIGDQTMRLAAAHPRSRIHAYEILPVPTRAGGAGCRAGAPPRTSLSSAHPRRR